MDEKQKITFYQANQKFEIADNEQLALLVTVLNNSSIPLHLAKKTFSQFSSNIVDAFVNSLQNNQILIMENQSSEHRRNTFKSRR